MLVLYALMGFRRFSHAISAIIAALKSGDLAAARRALAAWRGATTSELSSQDVARLAIERGLADAYRQVFAVLFWFVVLPGPGGRGSVSRGGVARRANGRARCPATT